MAQIQRVITGRNVVTVVRGREYRFAPKPRQQQQSAPKARRRVCVLNAHASRMMECWGEDQPCHGPKCTHTHQSRAAVEALVRDGVLRWVGRDHNVAAYSYGRTWKGMPSGTGGKLATRTMQLV